MGKVIFLIAGVNPNSAPFNRFISVVKATKIANYEIAVILIRPYKKLIGKIESDGKAQIEYDGILFENFSERSELQDGYFTKALKRLKTYYYALIKINTHKIKGSTITYMYSVSLIDYVIFFFISRIHGIKFINERSEYPLLIRNHQKFKTLSYKKFILPWCYKFFDGMVIMTDSLIQFYSKYTKKKCHILKLPMSVDASRFAIRGILQDKYIGYVGSLDCKKDGLDLLIKAFAKIHDKFPDYKLKIVGPQDKPGQETFLIELSKNLSLNNKVYILGEMKREDIPNFLCKSSILILARPESKQAEGGFPTKLGEYLITGNPVIVSNVGEISKYLVNGIDAFIFEPGNINDLVNKIFMVLENPAEASKVGRQGKKTAIQYFDYRSQSIALKDFFDTMLKSIK